MFTDNRRALLLVWFCLRFTPGRCSPASHSSECRATKCRTHQYCDPIEQRCSPCSPRVCRLKLAEEDCRPFCTEYRVRLATENGTSWESALEKVCKTRVPVVAATVLQLACLVLLLTLFVAVMAFYLRYKTLLAELRKPQNDSIDSTKVVKRNNLDVEMRMLRCKGGYNQENVCPPTVMAPETSPTPQTSPAIHQTSSIPQTPQTLELWKEPRQGCTCVEMSSLWDTGTERELIASGVSSDPVPGQLDSSSLESLSLLTGCFLQPSPLSQDA